MDFCNGDNPNMDISKQIAATLAAWMATHPSLDTIKKVATKSGVGFGTVQRVGAGEGNVTVQNLAAIAKAFGKLPQDLLGGDSPQKAEEKKPLFAGEPTPVKFKTAREERIEKINDLMTQMDDFGIVAMLEKAKDVARDYPAQVQQTLVK